MSEAVLPDFDFIPGDPVLEVEEAFEESPLLQLVRESQAEEEQDEAELAEPKTEKAPVDVLKVRAGFADKVCDRSNTTRPEKTDYIDFFALDKVRQNIAKRACFSCLDRDACLKLGLDINADGGMWGGSNDKERKAISAAYKKASESDEIDPETVTKGDFGLANFDTFVKPPTPDKSPKQAKSRPLNLNSLNCLGKYGSLFEKLDITPPEKMTKRMLAEGIAACMTCIIYEACSVDPPEIDPRSLPTVLGGEVVGKVPRDILPADRFVKVVLTQQSQRTSAAKQRSRSSEKVA